jgi:NADH-quinone oxidoreductase subunit N
MTESPSTLPLDNIASLGYFGPELVLIGAVLAVIIWDLVAKDHQRRVLGSVAISVAALA